MLELSFGTAVFVWDDHWQEEIEEQLGDYVYVAAKLSVRNESDNPDDTFYYLEAVGPADQDAAWQFLDRSTRQKHGGCRL